MTIPPPSGPPAPPLPYLTPQPAFRGRKGGLIGFGVVLIIMGAFCGLGAAMIPFVLFMASLAPPGSVPQQDVRGMIMGGIMYALLAALFVTTGIGSIRCRRWVRPIMQIVAWTWLATGVASMAMMLLLLPQMAVPPGAAGTAPPNLPAGFMYGILAITLLFLSIFYIGLPALLAWFYRRADVQQTLDFYDPGPAWTDRCPTAVLGLSLGMWLAAAMTLFSLLYNFMPFFGFLLTGWSAAVALVVTALLTAYAAWASFQCRPAGWWASTLILVALGASMLLTSMRHNITDFYAAIDMPQHQLDVIRQLSPGQQAALHLSMAVMWIACLAYMLYVRRYFTSGADTAMPVMVQGPTNSS